ncbi:MAG: UDP-glucose 4-epimerase [Phycisphaerales bacterium]|nr:UDP-glucose 4-epimerase [Phycisphaerales bacterium]
MSNIDRKILVTGAAGKVGQAFITRLLSEPGFSRTVIRALCHHRKLPASERVEVVTGNIADAGDVRRAMEGVSHVLHLATCKETPADIMDVTVKGLFWMLEECRQSASFRQFILIGGDAGMGHFFYPHPVPVTEQQKHSAYPGCYALSKVLEEVMLEQYYVQYGLNGCCLRAPWIMEKDDFKYTLTFGPDVFGGPRWCDLVSRDEAASYAKTNTVPVMLDPAGEPIKRNFVHVDDLVSAILAAIDHPKAHQQLFNVCMDEPVDYRQVGEYLHTTRGLPTVDIKTEFRSTWLDNAKARFLLGWRPRYDLKRLIDAAWDYQRGADEPRKVWYPG